MKMFHPSVTLMTKTHIESYGRCAISGNLLRVLFESLLPDSSTSLIVVTNMYKYSTSMGGARCLHPFTSLYMSVSVYFNSFYVLVEYCGHVCVVQFPTRLEGKVNRL